VELPLSVSGIGLLAAMTFLCEVTTLERFKNLDCLSSYVGLVPVLVMGATIYINNVLIIGSCSY
jgi:hypothetical protein